MDNKRREISTAEKCKRELEEKVHKLKKEKARNCALACFVYIV